MITIDSSFWSAVGVVLSDGNAKGNQYDFYNYIEMSNGETVTNQYEFFKNSPVDGVYYNDQYDWYRAVGVLYSEPIIDEYSFYQNVSVDGVKPAENQFEFFKALTAVVSGDVLPLIFDEYGFYNMYATENLNIVGSTTNHLDYNTTTPLDLANPSPTNQPTYLSSDSDFNNKPSLSYITNDYVINMAADYRISDSTGVIDLVFTSGTTVTGDFPLFASSQSTTTTYKLVVWVANGKIKLAIRIGGNTYAIETGVIINPLQKYSISVQQNGTSAKIAVNGVFEAVTSILLTAPATSWFNTIPNRDNLSIGALIQSGSFYYNGKIVFAGVRPYISDAKTLELFTGF